MPRYPHSRAILLASFAAFAVSLALVLSAESVPVFRLLRGGAGWRWPYEVPMHPLRLLPGIFVLGVYLIVGTHWLNRLEAVSYAFLRDGAFLWYCFFGGLAVSVALLFFYGNPITLLFTRTVSELSGGFFNVAAGVENLPETLRNYPELMTTVSAPHPKAHPPGLLLLFWWGARLLDGLPNLSESLAAPMQVSQCHNYALASLPNSTMSSAVVGMLFPVIGMTGVFLAYGFLKELYDRETGMRAALWLPLVPAMILFTPQPNQIYVPLFIAALWLWHKALAGKGESGPRPILFLLTGLVVSIATFLSFTNLSMLGVLGVYTVVFWYLSARHEWITGDWVRIAMGFVLFALGLASVWVVYYLVSGVSPFELIATGIVTHFGFAKPYLPWLFLHPLDVMLFSGTVLFTMMLLEALRASREVYDMYRTPQPTLVLPIAAVISFAGLAVLGIVRGEVGRLLLGMMPLVVMAAARGVQVRKNAPIDYWLPTAALGIQVIVMVAFLRVIGTELTPTPSTVYLGEASRPVQANFAGSADLVGFDADVVDDVLGLTLYWRVTHRFDHPYYMFGLVVDEENQPMADSNWLPVDRDYLTTCWQPGQLVVDSSSIPLDREPPGLYWVSLAMFDFETGERVVVTLPDGTTDDQIGLGPIEGD